MWIDGLMGTKILIAVTAHNEGELLLECLKNLVEAKESLANLSAVEIVINLDRSDRITEITASGTGLRTLSSDFGNPAHVRNHILESSQKSFDGIIFIDADDWVDQYWVQTAIKQHVQGKRASILTQNKRVHFWGRKMNLCISFRQPSADSRSILVKKAVKYTNLWGSSIYIPSDFFFLRFREYPSLETTEDWHYFQRALEEGIPITAIEGRLYYRQREGSLRRSFNRNRKNSQDSSWSSLFSHAFRKVIASVILLFFWSPLDSFRSAVRLRNMFDSTNSSNGDASFQNH